MPYIQIQDTRGNFVLDVHGSIAQARMEARKWLRKGKGAAEYRWEIDATYSVLKLIYVDADEPRMQGFLCYEEARVGDGDLTGGDDAQKVEVDY